MTVSPSATVRASRGRRGLALLGIAVLAVASVIHTWFAIPAAFFSLLGWITLPSPSRAATDEAPATFPSSKTQQVVLTCTSLAAAVAMLRFVTGDAIEGIVSGGASVVEVSAVTRLREILAAEDALRRGALIDPDEDGVGSAALLPELTRWDQLNGRPQLPQQALSYPPQQRIQTSQGPALKLGAYLFQVCLPTRDGKLSASLDAAYDAEAGERHFVAYAWPASPRGSSKIFSIDEYDRILETPNTRADGTFEYFGTEGPPPCDLSARSPQSWQAWRGKKPRASIPGL